MPTAATAKAPASGPRTPCLAIRWPAACDPIPAESASGTKARPVVERPPAEHVLEVERAEQEEPEDRACDGEHEDEAAADRAVGDPLDAEQRLVDVQLVDRERREPGEAADPADVRLDRSPASRVRLGDPVDDRGEAGRREGCACEVEAAPARLLRCRPGRPSARRTSRTAATGRLT